MNLYSIFFKNQNKEIESKIVYKNSTQIIEQHIFITIIRLDEIVTS